MPRNPTLPTRIRRSQVTLEIPQGLSGSAEGDRSRRGRAIGGQGRGVGAAAFGNPGNAASWRTYAVRRIRDAFRENKNVKDPVEIQTLVNKAKRDLGVIRRQVHIGQLYSTDKLIIENRDMPRT
ncbi:LYR motif-containing protein 4 isoform X1 [Gorilla gorilla gorilla]|uniref:LYR motif-containing protein 4 isoform X1 n=1 Tax=Gorilla gorilla gorilla TaxID=9595 RepID=UPI0008F4D7E0|nr:LYR motif-containing protein 4 isoform X1 [Gorilla gorilla gorilla]